MDRIHTSCKIEPPDLFFLGVLLAFKSEELHLILPVKKNFRQEFSFLTDSLKPIHPINGQNSLSVTKEFCQCPFNIYDKQQILLCISKLLKYIQKMLVVKGSNFVHSEKFSTIFQILIFLNGMKSNQKTNLELVHV